MRCWRGILVELYILDPMTVILYLPVQADSLEHLVGSSVEAGNIPMQFVIFGSLSRTEVSYCDDCFGSVPSQSMNRRECFIARPESQMAMFFPSAIPLIALCNGSRYNGFCNIIEGFKEVGLILFDLCKVVIVTFYDAAESFFWVCNASRVRM